MLLRRCPPATGTKIVPRLQRQKKPPVPVGLHWGNQPRRFRWRPRDCCPAAGL